MDIEEKVKILGEAAKYDVCASTCSPAPKRKGSLIGSVTSSGICHSYTPDGRCVSLFKVLMTNSCKNNCEYCVNRISNDFERTSFCPEELANLFMELYRRNYVEGLFLSSGIKKDTRSTMEEMIKTLEILRFKYKYGGYIHLKILPNSEENLIERGALLADRISINLEAPNPARLEKIAKEKNFALDLIRPMELMQRQIQKGLAKSGITTQFVVGASNESDTEIIKTTNWLYKNRSLKRAYFSAFVPINGTKLIPENTETQIARAPTPLLRENRLYQTDWLLRVYKFNLSEIVFDKNGNLLLEIDPKMAYAVKNKEKFPIEINTADFETLLKVPGLGVTSAKRIYQVRKEYKFNDLKELKNLGVSVKRASPFILINGKKQGTFRGLQSIEQLELFESEKKERVKILNA